MTLSPTIGLCECSAVVSDTTLELLCGCCSVLIELCATLVFKALLGLFLRTSESEPSSEERTISTIPSNSIADTLTDLESEPAGLVFPLLLFLLIVLLFFICETFLSSVGETNMSSVYKTFLTSDRATFLSLSST